MAYRTVDVLREGSGFSLLLKECDATGLRHVVKEVSAPDGDGYLSRQLRFEYEIFCGLDSPFLLKPVELSKNGKSLVYGEAQCTFAQYIARKGKLDPDLGATLLEQIGRALAALHAAGFVHTSLGPTSVFLGADNKVLLGAFRPYQPGGKDPVPDPDPIPKYQAPECNDSAFGSVGPSADIYSLGFLVLEALSGAGYLGIFGPGEQGDSLAWHLDPSKKLQDLRGSLPQVPAPLLDVIEGMITKSPPRRGIKTAVELIEQVSRKKLVSTHTFSGYQADREGGGFLLPAGPPRLLFLTPQGLTGGRKVTFVPGRPVLVGAQPGCDWMIRGKGMASRHAVLFCDRDGQWLLMDMRARGDCHVNDLREPVMPVKKGDILRVGSGTYLVDLGEPLDKSRMLCGVNVGRMLGRNKEGKLFLGNLDRRHQPVVLHVFPQVFGEDEAWVKRLLQDASTLGNNRKGAILGLHEVGRKVLSDKQVIWYLIRDYCLHGSMAKRIADGEGVPPQRLTRYASSACKALLEKSELGVVHGCLHPGSLLFDAADRMRVAFIPLPLDGKIGFRDEAGNPLLGSTVHYRAPELFGKNDPGNLATDVYALAACLLHYITGNLPFDSGNQSRFDVLGLKTKELGEFIPKEPGYPARETQELFRKALHPDPALRFRGPGDFIFACRKLLFPQSLGMDGLAKNDPS